MSLLRRVLWAGASALALASAYYQGVTRGIDDATERYRDILLSQREEQAKVLSRAEADVKRALKLCQSACKPVQASCSNEVVVGSQSSHIGVMGVRCEDPKDAVFCEAFETKEVNMFGNHCATRWFCAQPAVEPEELSTR